MDFGFDEAQEDLRKLARSILDEHATAERIKRVEATDDRVDHDLWREFARTDLIGVALPEDVGGSGLTLMELCVVLEEVGRRVAPIPMLSTVGLAALPIAHLGTDDQRKRLLVPVIEGTSFLTAAIDEPEQADSGLPATTATRDGAGLRLDGVKVGVPLAPIADKIVVTARTTDGEGVVLLVAPDAPGVGVESAFSTHRELQANVVFDGVSVESDDVLAIGDGALEFVHRNALACLCAVGSGVLTEAVRITASYISEREQFGKPIAAFQGATLKAADAYIDTEAVRVTTWSAIWRLAAGRPADEALAIAKFWIADGGQRVVHACQHLHGGIGVDVDYPIHRYFLWAKELELALGGATPQLLRLGASMAGDA